MDPVAASPMRPSDRVWCAPIPVLEQSHVEGVLQRNTAHAQVRNGGGQMLETDIEKLLAEVVASPNDLIDYHNLVGSFYSDMLPG